MDNLEELPTRITGTRNWVGEEHNINIDSSEREIQKSQIPVPYSESEANNIEFKDEVEIKRSVYNPPDAGKGVKEFSMKLDAGSSRFAIPSQGFGDDVNNQILELEYALRTEILKNEETQAMNMALKEMIENFQFNGQGMNQIGQGYQKKDSVRIGDVVKGERVSKTNDGVISTERELELKTEIMNLQEELQTVRIKNQDFEEQIYDLRDINQQANRDLKLAIESVKQAKDIESRFKKVQEENLSLKKEIINIQKHNEEVEGENDFDKEELKHQFKRTLDEIKNKYEEVIEELSNQNEEKGEKIKELNSKLHDEIANKREDDKRNNEFDLESKKELDRLFEENYKLKKEKDECLNEIESLKGKITGMNTKEVREIRELKREIEEKNENIQSLILQLEDNSINGDNDTTQRENEISMLNRELNQADEKIRKSNFQLRLVYSKVNYILKRITGRTFLDKSNLYS